jgi:hypothetical protein
MSAISARELRSHFGPMRGAAAASKPLAILGGVVLESLIISPAAMRHHYVARAVILDLQPAQMVAAIMATEDAIKATYKHARRTGWTAASDGLRIHFYAFTSEGSLR